MERDCSKENGCILRAMENMTSILKTPGTPDEVLELKREALLFLVHFFGDLHQPLHSRRQFIDGGKLTS